MYIGKGSHNIFVEWSRGTFQHSIAANVSTEHFVDLVKLYGLETLLMPALEEV